MGLFSFLPRERYLLVLMVLISLFYPIHYLTYSLFPAEGQVYSGHSDADSLVLLTLAKSHEWDFSHPYSAPGEETSTFFVPGLGSPFLYVPIGLFAYYSGIGYELLFGLLKFIFAFAYLVISYHIIRTFTPKKIFAIAMLIFLVGFGFGGVYNILFHDACFAPKGMMDVGNPFFGSSRVFNYDTTAATGIVPLLHIDRLYYTIPFVLGLLSLFLFVRDVQGERPRRFWLYGILLGLTFLLNPAWGFPIAIIFAIFVFVNFNRENVFSLIKVGLLSGVFIVPWLLISWKNPSFFLLYQKNTAPAYFIAVISSLGVHFFLILYALLSKVFRKKIVFVAVSLLVLFIEVFSVMTVKNTAQSFIMNQLLWLVISFCLSTSLIAYVIIKKKHTLFTKNRTYLFLLIWFGVMCALSVLPDIFWNSSRFVNFIWLPLSILSAQGIYLLASRFRRSRLALRVIVVCVILIGLPSFFFLNVNMQNVRGEGGVTYVEQSDLDGLEFLSGQERGTVYASDKMSRFLPVESAKAAILGSHMVVLDKASKVDEYELFMSGNMASEAMAEIPDKYALSYVFKSAEEEYDTGFLESDPGFTSIFRKGKTEIYRVD
ncbi:hypothetical protein ACFL3V_00985 [Nanoarchaeota archaeon]